MNRYKKNNSYGFTLIELIMTVAILGIIGAIAFPAYDRYKRKGYRMDAINYLTKAAAYQENWFAENGVYTSNKTNLGGNSTDEDHYAIAVTLSNANTAFSITATAKGAQSTDTECASYTIDNIGRHTAKKSDNSDNSKKCWGS